MRVLFIDGQAGVAGDMILGALVDLGVSCDELTRALRPVIPGSFSLRAERVSSYGLAATRLTVAVDEDVKHRHLAEVLKLLERGALTPSVRERAAAIFRRLAEAEAKIHSSTLDKVHFHEVGANDAVVDIVGAVWALEQLGIERVLCAPLVLGSGVGTSAHGPIHYPAPAVVEILKGTPVRYVADIGETTTPTGAAILAEIAEFTTDAFMTPERIGYGAGQKAFADRPNLLRAILGVVETSFEIDMLFLGTSDIDNTRPEVFGYVAERLRDAGAIDVVTSPVSMKKGRQGTRIEVLCQPELRDTLSGIITTETGTLGVRWQSVTRTKLERRVETVDTPWGAIRVKVASTSAGGERAVPEYDDCRAAASKHQVPLIEVIDRTAHLYYDQHPGPGTKRG